MLGLLATRSVVPGDAEGLLGLGPLVSRFEAPADAKGSLVLGLLSPWPVVPGGAEELPVPGPPVSWLVAPAGVEGPLVLTPWPPDLISAVIPAKVLGLFAARSNPLTMAMIGQIIHHMPKARA